MDKKQKEELKAKTKAAGQSTINALGKFANWSVKKSKEGYEKLQKHQEEQAEKKRIEEERLAKLNEANRIREEKEAKIRRRERHEKLIETLSDKFNALEHDLAPVLKILTKDQIKDKLYDVLGEDTTAFLYKGQRNNIDYSRGDCIKVIQAGGYHTLTRTVVGLSEKEIGILKFISLLNSIDVIDDDFYYYIQMVIIYNNGNSIFEKKPKQFRPGMYISGDVDAIVTALVQKSLEADKLNSEGGFEEAIREIGRVKKERNDPELNALIDKELKGVEGWMNPSVI